MLYLILPAAWGIHKQLQKSKLDKDLYGSFPVFTIICHVCITCAVFSSMFIDPALSPILAIIFYIIKLSFQCCIQEEFTAFDNVRDASETNEFLEEIRKRSPTAKFSVQCYHYEYTVEKDSDGNETQKKERVNTLNEDKFIQIFGFVDKTAPLYVKDAHSLIYLDISQEI